MLADDTHLAKMRARADAELYTAQQESKANEVSKDNQSQWVFFYVRPIHKESCAYQTVYLHALYIHE